MSGTPDTIERCNHDFPVGWCPLCLMDELRTANAELTQWRAQAAADLAAQAQEDGNAVRAWREATERVADLERENASLRARCELLVDKLEV